MRVMTAVTREVDFAEDAVSELKEQLDFDGLQANTIGIISCDVEFIASGVAAEVGRSMPFNVIGTTTLGNAAKDQYGNEMLVLTVYTADDIYFSAAKTATLDKETAEAEISKTYAEAAAGLNGENPALLLLLGPPISPVMGAQMLQYLDKAAGNKVPIYGSLASTNELNLISSKLLWNDEVCQNVLVIAAIGGNVSVDFELVSMTGSNIRQQKGTITKIDGFWLKEVDNIPVIDWLDKNGMPKENLLNSSISFPLMVEFRSGYPAIACGIYRLDAENGWLHMATLLPEGAKLSLGKQDLTGVLETAGTLADKLIKRSETRKLAAVLIGPCVSRSLIMGNARNEELKLLSEKLSEVVPYHAMYAGGEICPVFFENGDMVNIFHNFTASAAAIYSD
jgi:hypothetical protein